VHGYAYDAAGDVIQDPTHTYTYDAENRMTSANGWTYIYNGDGLRVEKKNGSTGTLFWRDIFGDTLATSDLTGNLQNSYYTDYIFIGGRRIASRSGLGSVHYYYADALGSVVTQTDGSGNNCFDATYTPYGQLAQQYAACPSNYQFAGYWKDSETGLYYAEARYYNPRLGRFMSADPLGGSIIPQSQNRYAYVINNTENLIDPFGLQSSSSEPSETDFFDGCIWSVTGGATYTLWVQQGSSLVPAGTGGTPGSTVMLSCFGDMMMGPTLQYGSEANFIQHLEDLVHKAGGLLAHRIHQAPQSPQTPTCTARQQEAANLAQLLNTASSESMWLGFGAGTVLAGACEGITLGGDTPFTLTFGSLTTFFGTTSALTGAAAAGLNAYASGNTSAISNFNWNGLATLAATAASSKLPFLKPWADRIGDLAGQAADLAASTKEPCQ